MGMGQHLAQGPVVSRRCCNLRQLCDARVHLWAGSRWRGLSQSLCCPVKPWALLTHDVTVHLLRIWQMEGQQVKHVAIPLPAANQVHPLARDAVASVDSCAQKHAGKAQPQDCCAGLRREPQSTCLRAAVCWTSQQLHCSAHAHHRDKFVRSCAVGLPTTWPVTACFA